jgi:parallel beta-helix repeat protein
VKEVAVLALFFLALAGSAQGATLAVAPSGSAYTSIQDAVDHAISGDTILIEAGHYPGPVTISVPLTLRGAGIAETTLASGAGSPGLSIVAGDIRIEGLTVQGDGTGTGIHATADSADFRDVGVTGWETGILMEGSQGSRVSDCEIQNNPGYGVALQGSTGITITRTSLRNNGGGGLYIDSTSTGNTVYLNNFENGQNVAVEASGNAWNSPGTISYTYGGREQQSVMGNYWNDHPFTDANNDGIMDSPYTIEPKKGKGSLKNPKAGETDLYPLATGWEAFFPAIQPTTVATPVITVTATSPSTDTPNPTSTTTTTTVPGDEGANIPPSGGEGPILYLLLVGLVLGLAGGGWYLMHRKNSPYVDTKGTLLSSEIHSSTSSTDTVLNRDVRLLEAGGASGEPHFPAELRDRYSQITYAGKGGIARVFKAQRNSDGRTVAVKIPVSFDEETGKAFMNEMRVWEDLHHPNIVEVSAVNILPLPFVEMEYLDRSLDRCPKPLDPVNVVRIIRGIAEGLSYAHRMGVIHQDLKPQNILLTSDLTPKIADWGLSRLLSQDTAAGMNGFSLPYASPEQLSPRQFGSTGPWTDIYQLGVIMYELLFGVPPFGGEGVYETGTAIISTPPVPPLDTQPGALSILPVVMRCLEKEPSRRYQSAEDFLMDLERH